MKTSPSKDDIRKIVRERYAGVATGAQNGCGCATPSCCSPQAPSVDAPSAKLGYSKKDLDAVPEGADMGLGCGNPQSIAGLKKGEVVLDLGAGGGFDCFLAARQVGLFCIYDVDAQAAFQYSLQHIKEYSYEHYIRRRTETPWGIRLSPGFD